MPKLARPKRLKQGASTDISKAAITQVIVLFIPLLIFDSIFVVLLFFTTVSLFDLLISSLSFIFIYISTVVALIYRAKGALADKDNFAPVTIVWPDMSVTTAWTHIQENVQEVDRDMVPGMMVAGKFQPGMESTWYANEIIFPETIEIPRSGGQHMRKLQAWTPAPFYETEGKQRVQTVSGALPVGALGTPLMVFVVTALVKDTEQGHIGEPVGIGSLQYSLYHAKLFLEGLGKLQPTNEQIMEIGESAARRQLMTIQMQLKGTLEHNAVLAETITQEGERKNEQVGEALAAHEAINRPTQRTVPWKWVIVGMIAIVAVSSLAALWILGVIP